MSGPLSLDRPPPYELDPQPWRGVLRERGVNHRPMTDQQQPQWGPPPSVSPRATYAFDLYQKCVLAGQWARITVEQRLDGEIISLFSRPQATAAKGQRKKPFRQPNKKRMEKERRWRENRSSKHI